MCGANPQGPTYWRSLRELHAKGSVDEITAEEFMNGVTDEFSMSELSVMSRKQFLALLAASAAFAAAGCSGYRDKGEIVPYTKKPEEITPGVANFYASTCTGCNQACGILIKTREGRPIKIDGNPDHPINQGAVCAKGQASILNLYDPNRLRSPQRGSASGKAGELTWKSADAEVRDALQDARANRKQIALILGGITSPTTRSLLRDFLSAFPSARLYGYEYFHNENRTRAWERSYGNRNLPVIAWDKAKVIVALESDFLGTEGFTVEQIRKFAAGRDIMNSKECNRLYCVEGAVSLTGANADYRLSVRPDAMLGLLFALMNDIGLVRGGIKLDPALAELCAGVTLKGFARKHGLSETILGHLVSDLLLNRGQSIIVAGETLPEEVHRAVDYLNHALGNNALYVSGVETYSKTGTTSEAEWDDLLRAMAAGAVGVVIHFDANPVYHLPPGLGYREALKSVPVTISLTEQEDETAQCCSVVLPIHHALESWGDYSVRTGITSLQQPVISPLYATRQREAILLTWMRDDWTYNEDIYHEYLMNRWTREVFPRLHGKVDFRSFWLSALHDGVVVDENDRASVPMYNGIAEAELKPPVTEDGFVVALRQNYFIGDGRFANNGWLQEIPHPISKIVWDNYAAVAPATAAELGVKDNDLIEISLGKATQIFPVFIQAGSAKKFVAIELGYGRSKAGPIGTGVGIDANVLLGKTAVMGSRVFAGAGVVKVEGSYELVSTQEHHILDEGPLADQLKDAHLKRGIIKEGTVEEYLRNPNFLHAEERELFSISHEVEYHGVKWAMAIDLNKCVGCNACVSGCNVENNIPVVGKDQVRRGREMQWIRIDRYYAGSPNAPTLSHQPMLCQHCDNAPCENVCPVVATNHSPDGLNQMVYNRCVGTKYCSNNCPYKVRRFNFYNFRDHLADGYYEQEPISLLHNPEVTVRSRGVMEKCTFCVQRIAEARKHATEQGRPVKGTDVKTACQEACPAQAIVFGDMNDPKSTITMYRKHSLGYYVLEEVNTRPNVTYIARLRNTTPETAS